jgi:hypothetical protein
MSQTNRHILLAFTFTLSAVACLLFLVLPASSLIVDLVYQAF